MAETLQGLNKKRQAAQNISQIAKAMEMIAGIKIKKAQAAVLNHKPYANEILNTIKRIVNNLDIKNIDHPYMKMNASKNKLLIVISPDKGFCGPLLTNLHNKFLEINDENTSTMTIGKKAERFISKLNSDIIATFNMGTLLPQYSFIYPIIEIINQYYLKEKISKVNILFTEYFSFTKQKSTVFQLLPLQFSGIKEAASIPYLFEPNSEFVFKEMLPYYIETELYDKLIQAFTSEQAVRMITMQNAKTNANEIQESLSLSYNKLRQWKITNEILDITNTQF